MAPTATAGESTALNAAPKPVHADASEAASQCNKWVESALTNNPAIQFLVQHLIDAGCAPPASFIRCMPCSQPAAGGFGMVEERVLDSVNQKMPAGNNSKNGVTTTKEQCDRTMMDLREQLRREQAGTSSLKIKPEIYVCQQYMENELMTHKTIAHELIHAIDMGAVFFECRTNMDPLHNCVQMACTEIRAENLSGECSFWKEFPRMERFAGHGQSCVRRRAILSVRANPNCTKNAENYVDAAMFRCFQDVFPFDRHPNQK